jgi:uncharacterized membrane protein YgaE (UPF0421/DUF939 family)
MVIPDLIFSIIIACCISVFFAWILSRKGPRKGFIWFFLLVFLGVMAGHVIAESIHYSLTVYRWMTLMFSGILIALLLVLLAPKHPRVKRDEQLNREETMEILQSVEKKDKDEYLAYLTFRSFCWVITVLLLIILFNFFF